MKRGSPGGGGRRAGDPARRTVSRGTRGRNARGEQEDLAPIVEGLSESLERFIELFELAPVASITLDGAGIIRSANAAAVRLLQKRRALLVGFSLVNQVVPADRARLLGFLGRLRRSEAEARAEVGMLVPDGRLLRAHLLGSRIPQRAEPKAEAFSVAIVDLSERWKAERALHEGESRLRTLADASFEGVAVLEGLTIVDCNDQLARILGREKESLLGLDLPSLVAPGADADQARLGSAKDGLSELELVHGDGGRIVVEARTRPILLDGRRLRCLALHDVTERRAAEEGLRRLNEELEARVRERTAKLDEANVALRHEVAERKRGQAELKRLSASLFKGQEEERKRVASELHEVTGQNLAAVAMNLSVLSRSAGGLPTSSRPLLDETANLTRITTEEVRSLSCVLHPHVLELLGLEAALRQFSQEPEALAGLTVKVVAKGSVPRLGAEKEMTLYRIAEEALLIAARHSGSGEATVSLSHDRRSIRLTVSDEGHGVPPGAGRAARTRGLGLVSIRERLEAVGGHLRVTSSSQGTTVVATLPR